MQKQYGVKKHSFMLEDSSVIPKYGSLEVGHGQVWLSLKLGSKAFSITLRDVKIFWKTFGSDMARPTNVCIMFIEIFKLIIGKRLYQLTFIALSY